MATPGRQGSDPGPSRKYWAFVTYSHQDNREVRSTGGKDRVCWGTWLHEALETYRVPVELVGAANVRGEVIPDRIYPVFRDEAELPTAANLGASIKEALIESRYLIVVCSPRSARSVYSNEEVRLFKALGRGNHILPVIVSGEPNASAGNKPGIDPADECFMPALLHPLATDGTLNATRRDIEPICADARVGEGKLEPDARTWQREAEHRTRVLLKLVAGVLGVGFDDLYQRDARRRAEANRQRHVRKLRVVTTGLCAAGLLGLASLADTAPQQWLRLRSLDVMQQLLPRERVTQPAVVVEIDERSLATYGQWPWPRSRIGELVERIAEMQPAAIGLDMFFPEPDRLSPRRVIASVPNLDVALKRQVARLPDNDALLAESLRGKRVVLGVAGEDGAAADDRPLKMALVLPRGESGGVLKIPQFAGVVRSLPVLEAAAAGQGLLNNAGEGVVRRVSLVGRLGDQVLPNLEIEMLRLAAGAQLVRATVDADGVRAIEVAGRLVPTEADGSVWLRYGIPDAARHLSAADLLAGTAAPELLQGKLVLVGITGLGLVDQPPIPLGYRVAGVEIRAQLIENIFDGSWLARPRWAGWLESASIFVCGSLLAAFFPYLRPGATVGATLVMLTALMLVPLVAFNLGWLFDAATPALAVVLVYIVSASAMRAVTTEAS